MPLHPNPSPIRLPKEVGFKLRTQLADGWSDNYGAIHLAARHAGVDLGNRPYFIRGIWQHGVVGPWQEHAPETLAYASPLLGRWPTFVAREEQAAALREAGFGNVTAIGMPFAYAPPSGLPRIPGSLLVVPTHTLYGASFSDRSPFERYAASIRSIASRFHRVVACIHPACVANGLWLREFNAIGIETVTGTKVDDLNALARVRALFDQFEYVTTNGWGSHVAYALACGCRVSIHGEAIEERPETARNWLRQDETWSKRPDLLAAIHNDDVFSRRRTYLDRLHVAPWLGVEDVSWGEWLIGTRHALPPAGMRSVLSRIVDTDWSPAPTEGTAASRWLFIVHEATRTGAPINLLHFLRWLRRETDVGFDILVGRDGALRRELLGVGSVFDTGALETLRARLPRYSLVYTNSICCGWLLEKLGGPLPPTVTHVHELDSAYEFFGATRMSQVLAQTRRFIACSDEVRNRLETRFGVPSGAVAVVPETCDPETVRAAARLAPAAVGLPEWPENAWVVIGCGSRSARKGIDLFIQVAAALHAQWTLPRPLRLVWIGQPDNSELARHAAADARKLGLESILTFHGAVENPFPAFARAGAFCLTSREDPYPLVMLEAAAIGLPLVAFEHSGGGADFCAQGCGIRVPYLDTAAMAASLLSLAQDPEQAARLGARGRQRVESHHSVDVVASHHFALLREYESGPWPRALSIHEVTARFPTNCTDEWAAYRALRARLQTVVAESRLRAQKGDRSGAASLLVKGASESAAAGDPPAIVASLVVLGDALAVLEPAQGKYLLGEAGRIATASGLTCELFRDPVWQPRLSHQGPTPSSPAEPLLVGEA